MRKWYDEEYFFEIEVLSVSKDDRTKNHCRNGEEKGDIYTCGYGCPVNSQGEGICSKAMTLLFPLMEAVRSGGDLVNLGGESRYVKELFCPDGVVKFRLSASRTGCDNFHRGGYYKE